ncbi:MAG: hypothetical protein ACJ73N_05235 [Bryobacteraceae bacterium]
MSAINALSSEGEIASSTGNQANALDQEKFMKLYLYSAVFAAALMCPSGYAQTINASARIPFNFRVGETVMPAGNYSIQDSRGVLRMLNSDRKKGVLHLTMNASRSAMARDPKLEFTRYGEDYYLTSIWSANSSEGQTLLQSKHERELASRFRSLEMAAVALKPALR